MPLVAFHFLVSLIQLPLSTVVLLPGFVLAFVADSPALVILEYVIAALVNLLVILLLLPAPFLIVDRGANVIDAIGDSVRQMSSNILIAFGAILVVWLGTTVVTLVTMGVGVLLTIPFMLVFLAVIYLKASGQRTAY